MSKLTRRFLLGSGVTVLVLGGASLMTCRAASRDLALRYDRLDVLLPDMVDYRRIGRAFRTKMGQEKLYAVAFGNQHIYKATARECAATRRELLRSGVCEDFRAGKIVLCDRLVLSETECIVAGLRHAKMAKGVSTSV